MNAPAPFRPKEASGAVTAPSTVGRLARSTPFPPIHGTAAAVALPVRAQLSAPPSGVSMQALRQQQEREREAIDSRHQAERESIDRRYHSRG